jgi:hypothetical protein
LIHKDEKLFRDACIHPFGGAANVQTYVKFLDETGAQIRAEASRREPSPNGPKSIAQVFAARHLSTDGPASYGYATWGFQDVMFVDVDIVLQAGGKSAIRNLVIMDRDGRWYVDPRPDLSPLLSTGFDRETESTLALAEAYDLRR